MVNSALSTETHTQELEATVCDQQNSKYYIITKICCTNALGKFLKNYKLAYPKGLKS